MQGGFKQTNLGPEFQRELEKFKREIEGIQQRIDEKKREKTRIEYQIKTEREIILKGNSQKKQKLVVLEKTIRGTEGDIRNAAEKYLAKIRNLNTKITELIKEIKTLKEERLKTKEGKEGEVKNREKTLDDLGRERNEIQTKIREFQVKLKEIEQEIKKGVQGPSSQKFQRETISIDQNIKTKELEKERLEKEKIKIQALVSSSSENISRGKVKAIQEREGIEKWVKSQVASLNLQKFENNLKEINNSILQLERQKIEAERSLSSTRMRLRR